MSTSTSGRASWWPWSVPTARARRRCFRFSPACSARARGTSASAVRWPGGGAIGWAPQQPALYARLSVAENLRLFARLEKAPDVEQIVDAMLEQTGLRDRADERVERLSGGNRQRVNVALALLARPRVLLLDEPSAALDPAQRGRLWQLVGSLVAPSDDRPATSVLFSTHHLGEVEQHATRAIVLADGELLFDDAPSELVGGDGAERGLDAAFVSFLAQRGHA